MIITFTTLIFAFLFLFKGVQKNTFFIFYAATMITAAFYCENYLGWKVYLFGRTSFMLFLLFHFPIINFFTFLAYGKDKRAAKQGDWRIPEIQLHTLELLGGTVGALAGQKIFHHKNKKKAYLATFWAATFIQLGLIYFILKSLGLWK
ncbi:MAG: DUF1294 domain-containing protein [Acetobacter sp.]|nr:DUF1294 domain-containing protein [Acetobacter sp.]